MFNTSKELIDYCTENNCKISDYVLQTEVHRSKKSQEEILGEIDEIIRVMEESAVNTLETGSDIPHHLIDNFGQKTWDYAKSEKTKVTNSELLKTMAMAFSGFETNSSMGKIVAAPTAGSAGILPAALMHAKEKLGLESEDLRPGILAAMGIGQFIGGYATFAGAEGGCQAECGSAASMAAAALAELFGATVEEVFDAASIALVNILGLVCDPIGGLVQYPCTFRNASGVTNAMISADLAMAGTYSIIPFEEVCQAMNEVGKAMPAKLRETGLGGLAGTKTGQKITKRIFG